MESFIWIQLVDKEQLRNALWQASKQEAHHVLYLIVGETKLNRVINSIEPSGNAQNIGGNVS